MNENNKLVSLTKVIQGIYPLFECVKQMYNKIK